jgi:hypothetical protein
MNRGTHDAKAPGRASGLKGRIGGLLREWGSRWELHEGDNFTFAYAHSLSHDCRFSTSSSPSTLL